MENDNKEILDQDVLDLIEEYKKYAEENGFKLNPDKEVVEKIVKGLLKRENKFGFRYCPCRVMSGDEEKDKSIICPCDFHCKEVEKLGHCICKLFFKKKTS